MVDMTRRGFALATPFVLAGCASGSLVNTGPNPSAIYGPLPQERFPVPAIDLTQINPAFYRSEVAYQTKEAPGTVVVDPSAHYLYLVHEGGMATRYGVGVGRQGFAWSGTARIGRKSPWPDWYPPIEMQARDKQAAKYAGGMPGGLGNPLGARAMYLYQNDQDTLYRLHGTNEPDSIGLSLSSGCIRMLNQDAIDLYNRVPVGTKVVVLKAV